jgi:hypothetical protein
MIVIFERKVSHSSRCLSNTGRPLAGPPPPPLPRPLYNYFPKHSAEQVSLTALGSVCCLPACIIHSVEIQILHTFCNVIEFVT